MKLKKAQQIAEEWYRIQESEPDISTERLLEMVSQETGVDNADVCEALIIAKRTDE